MTSLRNHLKAFRLNAEFSQQALADQAGISRQAYSALESGRATPSTEVALRLARSLEVPLESLFSLADDPPGAVQAELVGPAGFSDSAPIASNRVQLLKVGERLLARPVAGSAATRHSLSGAAGVLVGAGWMGGSASVQPFDRQQLEMTSLGLLGCDPAGALLEPGLMRHGVRLVWSEEGSRQALLGLARGEAHVAGCHLRDEDSGDYNFSWVRRLVPFGCTLVTFASWRQGLIIAPGNPKSIHGVADLVRSDIRIINRIAGSGSRSLLDHRLERDRIPVEMVSGYGREAGGHLEVAVVVASGAADAGVGVEAAATALGLDFVPLEEERYDLVIPDHFLDHTGVRVLLDLLRQPGLRRGVESLGGYDVTAMGIPVSEG